MEKDLFFYSNSFKLKGTINIPDINKEMEKLPAIIFSHGLGANKDEFGDFVFLADKLAEIKVASLRFDLKGCGYSEYPLGKMLFDTEWREDLKSAVSFIRAYPGIDQDKIGVIGESMGGANVIQVAGEDKRIKSIVSMSPFADGFDLIKHHWLENRSLGEFEDFLEKIETDRKRRSIYGYSNLLRMIDAIPYSKKYEELVEILGKTLDDKMFTYYIKYISIESMLSMRPIDVVNRISPRPLLIMAGKKDGIVPWQWNADKLFKKAREKKKLIVYEEGDHGLLADPTKEAVVGAIQSWLKETLIK